MSLLGDNNIDYNDIPDSLNLETGLYKETSVTKAKIITKKADSTQSLVLTFRNDDPDTETFGKTWDYFIGLPHPSMDDATKKEKGYYFKRNLKALGLTDHQIQNLSDPEMDDDSKEWLTDIEGILKLKTKDGFTNLVAFERTSANSTVATVNRPAPVPASNPEPVRETVPATAPAPKVSSDDDWD